MLNFNRKSTPLQCFAALLLLVPLLFSCGSPKGESATEATQENAPAEHRAVYFWKTTFDLTETEKEFLSTHKIDKLYLHLFDVALEKNWDTDSESIVPIATTRFVSAPPQGIEIVPVVYITLEVLEQYASHINGYYFEEQFLPELIITRVLNMCSYHNLGAIHEVQFDCDWNSSTRYGYNWFCDAAREILHRKGILLSGTIRLHQIEEAVYPFDKGVLMLYNTGSLMDWNTINSILSYGDVEKYLGVEKRMENFLSARKDNCSEISLAYPLFSWSVVYNKKGQLCGLLRTTDFSNEKNVVKQEANRYLVNENVTIENHNLPKRTNIRVEHSEIDEILLVKKLVESKLGPLIKSNILYHLDTKTISNYSDDEIEKILH